MKTRALIFVLLIKMNLGVMAMYTVEEFSFVNKQTKTTNGKEIGLKLPLSPHGWSNRPTIIKSLDLFSLSYVP